MSEDLDLASLRQFSGSTTFYRHWANRRLVYTEGMQYFFKQEKCYWLLDEIALHIFPCLMKKHRDSFYTLTFLVKENSITSITVDNGNKKRYLKRSISWTNFAIKNQRLKFFLCESEACYCLMLPSEY